VTPMALWSLLPLLAPACAVVVSLLWMSVQRSRTASLTLALLGLLGGAAATAVTPQAGLASFGGLLVVDRFAQVSWMLVLGSGAVAALMTHAWLVRRREPVGEAHVLVTLATVGAGLLAAATHAAVLLVGLEILSVSLYALLAYSRTRGPAARAGLHYLLNGAGSSAFVAFGLALLYAQTGALSLAGLTTALAGGPAPTVALVGGLLLLVGFGFKLALVPFHLWAGEVYRGAGAPMVAVLATVSKAGVLAALTRWTVQSPLGQVDGFVLGLTAMAGASMIVGNLLALREDNVKRLLAYSSVAHLGYAMVALVAGVPEAVSLYLYTYVVTTLGAFGALSLLARDADAAEVERLAGLRGLMWTHPGIALGLTVALLSLAGIPLTAGFMGKLGVLLAGVQDGGWALVASLVGGSVLGLFAYLRVIAAMFGDRTGTTSPLASASLAGRAAAVAGLLLVVGLGVSPFALWDL